MDAETANLVCDTLTQVFEKIDVLKQVYDTLRETGAVTDEISYYLVINCESVSRRMAEIIDTVIP